MSTAAGAVVGCLVVAVSWATRRAVMATRASMVVGRLAAAGMGPATGAATGAGALVPQGLRPPAWLGARLADVGAEADPSLVWTAWWSATAGGAVAGAVLGGPAFGALVVGTVAAAPVVGWLALRDRGAARYEAQLPGGLEALAAALRSGASLRQGIDEAARATPGPLGRDLAVVGRATAHGLPLVEALESWAGRRPLPGVQLAVGALCLGAETGAAEARAVDGVAATVRSKLAVASEVRALGSQARISAVVIALAPVAFCAFTTATDRRTASFLFRTAPGLLCLVSGLTLDAVAALWMARLSRVEP